MEQDQALKMERWTTAFASYGWEQMQDKLNQRVIGKKETIRLACLTMLAGGHLLLEDVPGVGKTLLARSLAQIADSSFRRIQMTPDMMPADITGSMVLHPSTGELRYSEGPLQAHVVLVDELNRASSRTQAALLEAMEERSVTVDGVTRALPKPFMVIATQNPFVFEGTYRLPEAELDRFMMKLSIGYPEVHAEADMLVREQSKGEIERIQRPVLTTEEWSLLIQRRRSIHVDAVLCRYISELVQATRRHDQVELGVSPRGSVALMQAAQAQALVSGRSYVIPEDIKALAVHVLAHRLVLRSSQHMTAEDVIQEVVHQISVPSFSKEARVSQERVKPHDILYSRTRMGSETQAVRAWLPPRETGEWEVSVRNPGGDSQESLKQDSDIDTSSKHQVSPRRRSKEGGSWFRGLFR
ncbi:AAA family ATPase [Paenibacillus sp. 1001270B_150601_E10]|uniref:AAA family ATPase n=1 Tax=Paenibacillus sp. 1001270B_150601_E10 TaxID=2787079 RepID=UPI00189EF2FC|nr:MoxR family ATPase [Paenibacillus sp. 1001270B_150601_E10]